MAKPRRRINKKSLNGAPAQIQKVLELQIERKRVASLSAASGKTDGDSGSVINDNSSQYDNDGVIDDEEEFSDRDSSEESFDNELDTTYGCGRLESEMGDCDEPCLNVDCHNYAPQLAYNYVLPSTAILLEALPLRDVLTSYGQLHLGKFASAEGIADESIVPPGFSDLAQRYEPTLGEPTIPKGNQPFQFVKQTKIFTRTECLISVADMFQLQKNIYVAILFKHSHKYLIARERTVICQDQDMRPMQPIPGLFAYRKFEKFVKDMRLDIADQYFKGEDQEKTLEFTEKFSEFLMPGLVPGLKRDDFAKPLLPMLRVPALSFDKDSEYTKMRELLEKN